MGCPSKVWLGSNMVFSICTHDPDTGVLTDADKAGFLPKTLYRIYEDENPTAITNGRMLKLDNANTTGFYSELIKCIPSNGYQVGKTYTIYITATVDSVKGGFSYAFKIIAALAIPYFRGRSSIMTVFEKDSKVITTFVDRSKVLTTYKRDSTIPT